MIPVVASQSGEQSHEKSDDNNKEAGIKQHEEEKEQVEQISSILGQLLLEDNYSIEQLLERARDKNLNLRELRDQLIKHQQELQQTSLELFNNSYDRFFKLSHLIACLAEPIKHVIQPIQNYRNQLNQLCQAHDNYLKDIDHKLAALEESSRNKLFAERFISLIRRRDRIFEQIHRIEWLKYPSVAQIFDTKALNNSTLDQTSITFKVNCDFIERVYIELHYLSCEASAIEPTSDELIPIKKALESSVSEQQRRLGDWFADAFYHAIQEQDKNFILFILRAYEQRGDFRELEVVWRQQVVRPYLNIILEADTRDVPQIQQTFTLLRQFLDKHTELIDQKFVARSFWSEVADSLDKLRNLYTSNDIRTFKQRYEMVRAFLEEQGKSEESSANSKRILAKFDLQGYFNQKSTEIRTSIEASFMQLPLSELPTDKNQQFDLKICSQIFQLTVRCWSDEIYIDALDDNFTHLACRVLEKFADWLSRLSLSDFRIVGTSSQQDRTMNFLARQDAIMRLLIEDCTKLVSYVRQYESNMPPPENEANSDLDVIDPTARQTISLRREAVSKSLDLVKSGLDNVRNLQKLLER